MRSVDDLPKEELETVKELVMSEDWGFPVLDIRIVGSYAVGAAHDKSDVDTTIIFDQYNNTRISHIDRIAKKHSKSNDG